jgi:hypothetical protein
MYLYFVAFIFWLVFSAPGCFELDSIAQQQGTESVEESLEHHRDDSIPHGA